MALTPKLEIRQSQSLLMTPQLRQAINLLQLTNTELNELLEQELNINPFLERETDRLTDTPDVSQPTIDDNPAFSDTTPDDEPVALMNDEQNNTFDDSESDSEGCLLENDFSWSDYNQSKGRTEDDYDFFEQRLADSPSLYTILEQQITLHFSSSSDKIIAHILSEQLDEAGYFRGDINKISSALGTSVERTSAILNKLKTFEPSGLFAENLAECLEIQLKDINRYDPAIACLLQHLDLLAERNFKELKRICKINDEDLISIIEDIKSLNPKPAASFNSDKPAYVIPDVFVRRNKDGSYFVELNNMSLPRLLINRSYYSEICKISENSRDAKRYLKENMSHANFLLKSLHQRATTILRVSEEIVRRQQDFFEKGIEHLKPMSLKDIAYALELHESTVSRVTGKKFMQTPRGLFELKYFFSAAAGSYTGNEETSTLTIKHRIKELISAETPDNILSDDKLVELLAQQGIKIARRTVAKYRDSLNIPTSAQRRRLNRNIS